MWGFSSYGCGRWPNLLEKTPKHDKKVYSHCKELHFLKGARRAAIPPILPGFSSNFCFLDIYLPYVDDVWWINFSKSSAICVNFYSVFPPDRTSLLMGGNEQKNLALLEPANEVFVHRPSTPLSLSMFVLYEYACTIRLYYYECNIYTYNR